MLSINWKASEIKKIVIELRKKPKIKKKIIMHKIDRFVIKRGKNFCKNNIITKTHVQVNRIQSKNFGDKSTEPNVKH